VSEVEPGDLFCHQFPGEPPFTKVKLSFFSLTARNITEPGLPFNSDLQRRKRGRSKDVVLIWLVESDYYYINTNTAVYDFR